MKSVKNFGVGNAGQIPLHPDVEGRSPRLTVRLPFVIAACVVIAVGLFMVFFR